MSADDRLDLSDKQRDLLICGALGVTAAAGGALVSQHHVLVAVILAPAVIAGFTRSSWVRIGSLVLLAMQAFGSSSGFNAAKLAWIILVPITIVFARHSDPGEQRQPLSAGARKLAYAQALWAAYLALEAIRSLEAGNPVPQVLRDTVAYVTWSLFLLWALDLASSRLIMIQRLTLVVTSLYSIGMGLTWMSLRSGTPLPAVLMFGGSMSMAGLGVILAAGTILLRGISPLATLSLMASVLGLILSGSRTFLIVPVALIVLALGFRRAGIAVVGAWRSSPSSSSSRCNSYRPSRTVWGWMKATCRLVSRPQRRSSARGGTRTPPL
jgi:hypothetical protein